jgi:hypothetical protein
VFPAYEGLSKSFRTGRLERELQMAQLSATRWSCIAIWWVSLVSFAATNLCVASQRVFIVLLLFISLSTRSGNFWIHLRTNVHSIFNFFFFYPVSIQVPSLVVETPTKVSDNLLNGPSIMIDETRTVAEWYWQERTKAATVNQCPFLHHIPHADSPVIEPRPPQWETGAWTLELWRGLHRVKTEPKVWFDLQLKCHWIKIFLLAYKFRLL